MNWKPDEDFQKCLEIGQRGEDIVKQALTDAGFSVWDISKHKHKYRRKGGHKYKYLHVDLYTTGEHRFWVEVKVRYSHFWIDTNDIEWLVDWHVKTHIPPFIVFVNREGVCYIISVYEARNKHRLGYIRFQDTVPLDDWLAKVKKFPNKWRSII